MGKLGQKMKSQAHGIKKNIDQRLLELTSVSVDKVRTQWTKAAVKLDLDHDLPSYLVGRILEKAKSVRESIPSEEGVQKAIGQARVRKAKLQKQMIDRALKVKVRAQSARSEIVKNSPLKRRSKKSKTKS